MYRSRKRWIPGNYFRRGGTTDSRETHKGSRTPHQEVRRRTRIGNSEWSLRTIYSI